MEHKELKPATVSFTDDLLILRIKTPLPGATLISIIQGIHVAMRESLYMESLTKEDRNALAALQQLAIDLLQDRTITGKAVA